MVEELTANGVDVDGVAVDPDVPTGVTVVLSRQDDRAMLTSAGTIESLSGALVDRDLVRSARHVHVSSYFLQGGLRPDLPELFREAHAAGATTSVDPNGDPSEEWDGELLALLSLVDVFLPNSIEARAITGIDDIDVASESLASRGGICGGTYAFEPSPTFPVELARRGIGAAPFGSCMYINITTRA